MHRKERQIRKGSKNIRQENKAKLIKLKLKDETVKESLRIFLISAVVATKNISFKLQPALSAIAQQ